MMRGTWTASITIAVLLAAGCGDNIGPDLSPLAVRAQEVRELEFVEDVDVVVKTRQQFMDEAADQASELDDAWLAELADTWGRLGYFQRDLDLRPILAGSSSDWVAANYSPRQKRITLVGEVEDYIEVHEYVHALQDQHFDLVGYDGLTSDSFLARRAVVEGDAVLAEVRFIMEDEFAVRLENANWADALPERRDFAAETLSLADYPVFFLDYPSFVYTYGLEYTVSNLMGVSVDQPQPGPPPYDWGREDALFTTHPPASTQQVLVRDAGRETEPIVEIGLEEVPAELMDRLDAIDWDTLGEWYIYLLYYPLERAGSIDARALASGWDGDRVLFVRDLETDTVATVWASAWDSEAYANLAKTWLASMYGGEPVDGAPEPRRLAADGEELWIEQRGDRLVAIRNLDPVLAPALAEAAFSGPAARRSARKRPPIGRLRRALLD
jgi:hypothetical protein